ncbi:leucyl/phenylalanyl-tRNA--protein transferase [Candidatus Endobugula sertula]|uniref:Leucyl/phenylalanyl-tRNA--protein transferase n=1 Tax=Candidatus Endobugula sertula TaxID=62101 RepID=A0A1D2QPB9_9GAMM|nr:leucyl/phenylalanyl-tRNA--protein transferase [Candidatus Endobugula sertula]
MFQLPWLDPNIIEFPDTYGALKEPNGLLAAGGQLNTQWLLKAYSLGIFPWFSEGEPILWWSPSPRAIIYVNQLYISKSLRKILKKNIVRISFNQAFTSVINACSQPRPKQEQDSTWITDEVKQAYIQLHHLGYAHSVEVWQENQLVGGLYGISLGRMFFGESMFSLIPNSSKIALTHLVEKLKQWQYIAIDCQVYNNHLPSLGAIQIPRIEFEILLRDHVEGIPCHWNGSPNHYKDT